MPLGNYCSCWKLKVNEFWFVVCIVETPVLFSLFLFLVLLARDGGVSFVVTSDSDKKTGEKIRLEDEEVGKEKRMRMFM